MKSSVISFETTLFKIGSYTILLLPKSASEKLPSRGMTMITGTINGFPFQSELEPDGRGSHWCKVNRSMLKGSHAKEGDTVFVEMKFIKDWPEPKVPEDLQQELSSSPKAHHLWTQITPMARWDWIRWIGSTKQPETRKRRIEVSCSKLTKGERRPCCFNRSICCDPYVSNNGVLLAPK